MDGHRQMLNWYASHGFGMDDGLPALRNDIDIDKIPYLNFALYPLYGIDFHTHHCLPSLVLGHLASAGIDLSEKEIRRVIWKCRSGVNYRKPSIASAKDEEMYESISNYVDDTCLYLLRKKQNQVYKY